MSTSKLLAGRLSGLAVLGAATLIAAPLSAYGDTEPAPAGSAAAATGAAAKTPAVTVGATADATADTTADTTVGAPADTTVDAPAGATVDTPADATADAAAKMPAITGATADAASTTAASVDPVTGDALAAPVYAAGTLWGIIGRNTLGTPNAVLREGPYGRVSGQFPVTQAPPYGTGSLGLIVGGADTPLEADKIMWGNERIFAGGDLDAIRRLSYWVFAGVDDLDGVTLPNITIEVDPNRDTTTNYTSLVYLPNESDSPSAPANPTENLWQRYDALASGNQWFATGATGTDIGCTLASPCTFQFIRSQMPQAVISYSLGISKGRDDAFVGAVDGLQVNGTVYDFEFTGVRARPA
ncbi:hypothetical protein SAMN05421874_11689 [Nonomuraea maritima]|uniref:Uncharacterized protein n=1 Tax=Nonomuraea maritima TaxID=683260 RepID=A0A1G9HL23_9ACTN|nr:hypothetical protein [Nonomuraea maritima]SDL13582.1 hypothetical protein SAMN05421874_11689 [Nonomuraea maritima]